MSLLHGVSLREATWRDLAAMSDLETRCFPHDAWPAATFWAELANRPRRSYWVAVDTGAGAGTAAEQVVGYAGLDVGGDRADVMTVAVDPARRGSGLGAQLLDTLETQAGEGGADAVMLEVRADHEAARSLYSTRGFLVVHTRRGYYRSTDGSPPVDALVMRKELDGP